MGEDATKAHSSLRSSSGFNFYSSLWALSQQPLNSILTLGLSLFSCLVLGWVVCGRFTKTKICFWAWEWGRWSAASGLGRSKWSHNICENSSKTCWENRWRADRMCKAVNEAKGQHIVELCFQCCCKYCRYHQKFCVCEGEHVCTVASTQRQWQRDSLK